MVVYNYRVTNLNIALLVAQLENLDNFIEKRKLSDMYGEFFKGVDYKFVKDPAESSSNYWLNLIILNNKQHRDIFLNESNAQGVMTRPIWILMNKLLMYKDVQCGDLTNSEWLEDRVANIPSSVIL